MKPINLGIGNLEAVLAVAQTGSFRAAAESLHLSQPSVSARVQHAEDVLGVKLFHRTTRRVTITEHGERLCSRAEHTIAELRSVLKEFKDEAQLKRGRIVLGATPTIASSIVPEVIRRFTQRWPGVEVILRDDFLGRSLDRLTSGEVEFAITPFQKADPRFDFELLYSDELLLIAPAGHPLLKKSSVSLAAVSKYPVLTMPVQTAIWGITADAFAAEGIEFKPAFQTMHVLSMIAMVRAGFGVTFLPRLIIPLLNMESFGVARVGRNGLHRQLGLTTAHGRATRPAAESLMDAFRAAAGNTGKRS